MLFNPTSLDQLSVQAQYLEEVGKQKQQYEANSNRNQNQKGRQEKWKGKTQNKKTNTTTKKEDDKRHCTHYDKDGHVDAKCWKLHPELASYDKKNSSTNVQEKAAIATKTKNVRKSSKVDDNIICASIQKAEISKEKCNVEEKRMQLFHIKI